MLRQCLSILEYIILYTAKHIIVTDVHQGTTQVTHTKCASEKWHHLARQFGQVAMLEKQRATTDD